MSRHTSDKDLSGVPQPKKQTIMNKRKAAQGGESGDGALGERRRKRGETRSDTQSFVTFSNVVSISPVCLSSSTMAAINKSSCSDSLRTSCARVE